MMRKTTSWKRNFRRWSVRLSAMGAALGGIEALAHVAQAAQTSLPLWEPVLPPWGFAITSTSLYMLIGWARNIAQEDIE